MMTDDTTTTAAAPDEKARERADVRRWQKAIEDARKFDENARVQYAKDRRMARGDTAALVEANLLGTYIDITESFLYAKNPEVDVLPARATEPPDLKALQDAVEATQIPSDPFALAQGAQGLMQQVEELRKRYRKRQRDNKSFAESMELVISQFWRDANLKKRGRKMTRSTLTTACGWLKASWQERTAPSPETVQQINDLQGNLLRLRSQQEQLQDAHGDEREALIADMERQIQALQGQTERVIARGYVIDFARSENIQVAPGVDLDDYTDAPWIAHREPKRVDEAMAEFGLSKEKIAKATRYSPRKPEMGKESSPQTETNHDEKDADAYIAQTAGGDDAENYVMVWEIWDRETNSVLTTIEGLTCWVKPAWQPCATTRFYPFFLFALNAVDGQRHPQSLVSRSAKLIDEYNRIGTAEAKHRRRIMPKTVFDAGELDPEEAAKIAKATENEMVPVKLINPQKTLDQVIREVVYAQLDPALYARGPIVAELERLWGIQEALSGAVDVAKTATEAEIQQTGFNARSGARRDLLEDVLSDLARYTAEVAWCYMTTEDVVRIVGPDAFWPQYIGPEALSAMVNVEIRAGTSGKPNSRAEREAWSTLLPMLEQGIERIGMLRGAAPADMADAHERLLRMTAERSGERIDMDPMIPQAAAAPPGLIPGMPPVQPPVQPEPVGAMP